MEGFEYLGTVDLDANGKPYIRRPEIPSAPPRACRAIEVPQNVARRVEANEVWLAQVVGDSMQPTILANDCLVVSGTLLPRNNDVVVVASPHPVPSDIPLSVWRYVYRAGRAYIRKDNARDRGEVTVSGSEIVGVVTRVLPRQYRDELENYMHVQRGLLYHRDFGWGEPPADLGFFRERHVAEFRATVAIPSCELIDGRLPLGLFRGMAIADHPHVRISSGDTLTIEPTGGGQVGDIVIERSREGENIVGVLQRDPTPGDFFIDIGQRRVAMTAANGQRDLWRTIGLVRKIDRRRRSRR